MNISGAGPRDAICILGLGGVGLSAVMGAAIQGCRTIIGVDRVASRLALAREVGATHVIDGAALAAEKGGRTLGEVVRELTEGVGPTITIDTSGAPALMDAGMQFTRNRGKYIQVGSPPFDYTLGSVRGFEFMVAGKQWIGAIEGGAFPPEYVPRMIRWYREGRFPIEKLMKLMPADDFARALHEMHSGVSFFSSFSSSFLWDTVNPPQPTNRRGIWNWNRVLTSVRFCAAILGDYQAYVSRRATPLLLTRHVTSCIC